MKHEQQMEAERSRLLRGKDYEPTPDMKARQKAYLKLLEDKKAGVAPLYVTCTGRVFK